MRSQKVMLFLIIAFSCLFINTSATAKAFPLVHSQETMKEQATNDHQESSINKLARGVNGGGTNGGGDTNGGPHQNGGGASVIPLYAAGSGNNHHNHRGGGNRAKSTMEHATLVITAFACVVLCIYKD